MKKATPSSDHLNRILMLYALIILVFISSFAAAQNTVVSKCAEIFSGS